MAYASLIISTRVLNPLDTSWYGDDPAQSYLGWVFFRHEQRLVLPLGWSHAIAYPLGEPIAYFDSIPIIATALWFFRNVLPAEFQYHGLYIVINCILQFYFGLRICRIFAREHPAFCVIGALFFLIAPIFTRRTSGHFALTSQWLILAAIERFLIANRGHPSNIWFDALLCFIAGAISPYITAMVLIVLSAASIRLALGAFVGPYATRVAGVARALAAFAVAVAAALGSLLLFGFLRLDEVLLNADGYGTFSMNLLAPIDPLFPALLLKPLEIRPGQYEGYNYLGLGVIILAVAALARRPQLFRLLASRDAIFPWCIVLVCLGLAMSSIGTAGTRVLYNIPLPDSVYAALSNFRASGRLFWPAYYLILTAILASVYRGFGRYCAPILLAAFLIQYVDLASVRAFVYQRRATMRATVLPIGEPAWRTLGAAHKHLVVLPPWQCSANTPGGANGWWLFGKLAADQNMTINSFYAARTSAARVEFFCNQQLRDLESAGMRADTAYVLQPSYARHLSPELLADHYCELLGSIALCSREPGRAGKSDTLMNALRQVDLGEQVALTDSSRGAFELSAAGWAEQENGGRWMIGPEATLIIRTPERREGIDIHFDLQPFLPPGHVQRVEVFVAGQRAAQWRFDGTGSNDRTLRVAGSDIGQHGVISLKFVLPDAISPTSRGVSSDSPPLAVALRSFRVTETAH
jgi:hypothetical protein